MRDSPSGPPASSILRPELQQEHLSRDMRLQRTSSPTANIKANYEWKCTRQPLGVAIAKQSVAVEEQVAKVEAMCDSTQCNLQTRRIDLWFH